jgi:hypothetical protein
MKDGSTLEVGVSIHGHVLLRINGGEPIKLAPDTAELIARSLDAAARSARKAVPRPRKVDA